MTNKGFSIIECVFCIVLLTFTITGSLSLFTKLKMDNLKNSYEIALYTNLHTILNLCESDINNIEKNIKEVYSNVYFDSEKITITINLDVLYKNVDAITYELKYYEDESGIMVEVEVVNVLDEYKEVNNEIFKKRLCQK